MPCHDDILQYPGPVLFDLGSPKRLVRENIFKLFGQAATTHVLTMYSTPFTAVNLHKKSCSLQNEVGLRHAL